MKKHLLLAALVLSGVCLQAQLAWFQIGDEWTFEVYKGWFPEVSGLNRIKIEKEVNLGGESWMWLRRYHYLDSSPNAYHYARQEGDKIYVWGGVNSKRLVYDFSLVPGDTLKFIPSYYYAVLDTGSVFLAGQVRRTQTVQHSFINYPLLLVEGIGAVGNPEDSDDKYACSYIFLDADFCHAAGDGTTAYFRCFGNTQGVYAPFEGCLVSADKLDAPTPVRVWPNPANDRLFVQGNCRMLQLCDAQGRIVLEEKRFAGNTTEIPTCQLPNGLYFLICRFDGGEIYTHKVVLSR